MNCILVFAVAAIIAVSCYAAPPCQTEEAIAVKCATDNGFNVASLTAQTQFTAENLRTQCSQLTQYQNTINCMSDELTRCSISDPIFTKSSVQQMSQVLGVICSDPNFKLNCMDQIDQQQAAVQTCMASQTGSLDYTSPTATCQLAAAGIKCTTDVVKRCDDHTGTIFGNVAKLYGPPGCPVGTR